MGDAGQQQGALTAGLLDILCHLVEGMVDLGNLRRTAGIQQAHIAPLTDAFGGALQRLQRANQLANQYPGGPYREHGDRQQPGDHHPDTLATQGVRHQGHLQPMAAVIARLMNPDRRILADAHAYLGLITQLVA